MSKVERSKALARDGTAASVALKSFPARGLSREDGPLYRQVASILTTAISSGALPPGASLPREADIAARFGVSLITVRQAMRDLQTGGLIRKRAARPAVVAAPERPAHPNFAFQSFAQIAASTKDRRLVIHSYRKERSDAASAAFGLRPGAVCHCLRATVFQDAQPGSETTFYFPPAIGGRLKRSDFDDVVVFRAVQRHLGIRLSSVKITVRADVADQVLSDTLHYPVGDPILVIEMLYLSDEGEPVELTISKNRADLFSLSYEAPNDLP